MTVEEIELRSRLTETVCDLRKLLARCPWIDDLGRLGREAVEEASDIGEQINEYLRDANTYTDVLAELRDASDEAVSLVATSRTALGVVREVLTVLMAAIDHRLAA
jgi:phosphate uptake regulator